MELRDWQAGDLEMLLGWAERDPSVAVLLVPDGQPVTQEHLDRSVPEKVVAEIEGEAVGVVGMQRIGPEVASVHIMASPDHRTYAEVSPLYDLGEKWAQGLGIVVALALIPADNKASQFMALRKGFKVVPTVIMTKVLPNGKEG